MGFYGFDIGTMHITMPFLTFSDHFPSELIMDQQNEDGDAIASASASSHFGTFGSDAFIRFATSGLDMSAELWLRWFADTA